MLHDMLGIYEDIRPKFVKRYAELSRLISGAVSQYSNDVKQGRFPEETNIFHMDGEEADRFKRHLRKGEAK